MKSSTYLTRYYRSRKMGFVVRLVRFRCLGVSELFPVCYRVTFMWVIFVFFLKLSIVPRETSREWVVEACVPIFCILCPFPPPPGEGDIHRVSGPLWGVVGLTKVCPVRGNNKSL